MTTPKHCVFIPFFLVCFIKAEHLPNVRKPANLEKLRQMAETLPGRKPLKWQKALSMAENPSIVRKPTNGRNSLNWQKPYFWQQVCHMSESLPAGRQPTIWQKTYQVAEHLPSGRTPAKWQNSIHTMSYIR